MIHEPDTEHVLALAVIIRKVNGGQRLGAVALAEAILAHPNSQWRPVLPVPTDVELETNFRAWFHGRYPCFGGINLRDVIAWGKHLLQHSPQPATPWPGLPREVPPEVLNRAMSICKIDAVKAAWQAACDQLENLKLSPQSVEDQDRQRAAAIAAAAWQWKRYKETRDQEGKGAAPTPAPAFPEISDQLIRSLIGDVLAVTGTATEQSCLGRCLNPVPEVRARLCEILQLAAQESAEKPAS